MFRQHDSNNHGESRIYFLKSFSASNLKTFFIWLLTRITSNCLNLCLIDRWDSRMKIIPTSHMQCLICSCPKYRRWDSQRQLQTQTVISGLGAPFYSRCGNSGSFWHSWEAQVWDLRAKGSWSRNTLKPWSLKPKPSTLKTKEKSRENPKTYWAKSGVSSVFVASFGSFLWQMLVNIP